MKGPEDTPRRLPCWRKLFLWNIFLAKVYLLTVSSQLIFLRMGFSITDLLCAVIVALRSLPGKKVETRCPIPGKT
jgi:hypothetical protein